MSNPPTVVRWGVLGAARIARLHMIPAILRRPEARLQAIASRDRAKLAAFAEQFGPFTAHADYEALLDDPEVDAVYIPLPNALHYAWTLRALRAGKHVLCEKPLALNAAEADEMFRTADTHQVRLMEAFMYRYTERMAHVGDILASGVLGDIRSVNSTFRFLLDREDPIQRNAQLGGGALYDVGVYPINLSGLVTQAEPVAIAVEHAEQDGVDVNLSAVLRYADGLIATLHCGFDAFRRNYSEIVGTRGALLIPDTFQDHAGEITLITAEGERRIPIGLSDRYGKEIADFSSAILENRPPRLTPQESLRNQRVLDRIRAAMHRRDSA